MRGTIARTSLAEVLSVPKFHVSRIRRRTESAMLRSSFRKVASLWATSMGASLGRRHFLTVCLKATTLVCAGTQGIEADRLLSHGRLGLPASLIFFASLGV